MGPLEFYSWDDRGVDDYDANLLTMRTTPPLVRKFSGEMSRFATRRWRRFLCCSCVSFFPFEAGEYEFTARGRRNLQIWYGTSLNDMNVVYQGRQNGTTPYISIGNLEGGQISNFVFIWDRVVNNEQPYCEIFIRRANVGAQRTQFGNPVIGKYRKGELKWLDYLN